jgi:hypothetical protein
MNEPRAIYQMLPLSVAKKEMCCCQFMLRLLEKEMMLINHKLSHMID